jgi:hypothetical protein
MVAWLASFRRGWFPTQNRDLPLILGLVERRGPRPHVTEALLSRAEQPPWQARQ